MKAIVYENYGAPDVLKLRDIEKPTPQPDEVLIKIAATTVTSGDCRVRSLNVPVGFGFLIRLAFGVSKPRQTILGSEFAGVVESVGKDVRAFKVGDEVFGFSDAAMGCYVEYKCLPENSALALKPGNLSLNEAAALSFGGTTALAFLSKAMLQRGDKILINGASGSVGTAAVQLAKHFGAEVTAVCSTANVELLKSLKADHVVDYSKFDFTQNGRSYDVIMDNAGTAPFTRCKASLKRGGRLLIVIASLPDMLKIPWINLTSGKKVIAGTATADAADLQFIASLVEAGEFKPVIDRRYPFEQAVAAHRYVDTGRKKGNVILEFVQESKLALKD